MDEETEKIQAQEIRDIRGSRLQKFARILSGRWELILEVLSGNLIHGGSTVIACCDCTNHISITEKIKEARDEVENLAFQKTLTMHEVGHLLFTNAILWKNERNVSHGLGNIIEDGRVELGLSAMYPLAKNYFLYTNNKLLINPGKVIDSVDNQVGWSTKHSVGNWILYEAKKRTCPFDYSIVEEEKAKEALGTKFSRAKELVNLAVMAKKEKEAITYAVELQSLLGDIFPRQRLDFANCGAGCRQLPNSVVKIKAFPTSGKEGKEGIESISVEISEDVSKELYEESKEIKASVGGWAGLGKEENDWSQGERVSLREAENHAQRIARILKALATVGNGWVRNKRRGRIDTRKLYRVSLRSNKVFKKKDEVENVKDLSVGILIDCSGSMGGIKGLAAKSCYSLARAMEICKFDSAVLGFSDGVYPIVNFKQSVIRNRDKFKGRAIGGTVMSNGLNWMIDSLEKRDSKRKAIFLITDGQPSDSGPFYSLLPKLKEKRIMFFTFNIGGWSIPNWKENISKVGSVVNISNLLELVPKIDLLLRSMVVRKG